MDVQVFQITVLGPSHKGKDDKEEKGKEIKYEVRLPDNRKDKLEDLAFECAKKHLKETDTKFAKIDKLKFIKRELATGVIEKSITNRTIKETKDHKGQIGYDIQRIFS